MNDYDVIVTGAGPAGLTAGIYAARYGLNVLVLEKMFPGGQIASTHLLENYPGFPKGIGGMDFAIAVKEQAEAQGAQIKSSGALSVKKAEGGFLVDTASSTYFAKAVILASGAYPRKLGLEGEDKWTGMGISYCATCDGAFFKGRDVCVVGGGDTALEDALYLSSIAKRVYLIHRRDSYRAAGRLVERVRAAANITEKLSFVPEAINGGVDFEGIRIKSVKDGSFEDIAADGCFVAVGYIPDTGYLKGFVGLDEAGYIAAGEDTRTTVPGVFAAGDARRKSLRQVVTAVADGAVAAAEAFRFISESR